MSGNLKFFLFITLFLNLKSVSAAITEENFNAWRDSFREEKKIYFDSTLEFLKQHIIVETENYIAEDLVKLKSLLDKNDSDVALGCVQFFVRLGLLQRYLRSGRLIFFIRNLSCKLFEKNEHLVNSPFLIRNPAICVVLNMCGGYYSQEKFIVNYNNGTLAQKEAILNYLAALILEVGVNCHLREWNAQDISLVKNLVLKFGFEQISFLFQEKSLSACLKQIISFLGPAFSVKTKEQILNWVEEFVISEIENKGYILLSHKVLFEIHVLLWGLGFKIESEHFFCTGDTIYNYGRVIKMTRKECDSYCASKKIQSGEREGAPSAKKRCVGQQAASSSKVLAHSKEDAAASSIAGA